MRARTVDELPPDQAAFWRDFLAATGRPADTAVSDVFFADSEAAATELAALVLAGTKVGAAALVWTCERGGETVLDVGSGVGGTARFIAETCGARSRVRHLRRARRPGRGRPRLPVPRAAGPATSFLATPEEMRALLGEAGFTVEHEADRHDEALDVLARQRARTAEGPPPVGLGTLIGAGFAERMANLAGNLSARRCGPWEFVARRR